MALQEKKLAHTKVQLTEDRKGVKELETTCQQSLNSFFGLAIATLASLFSLPTGVPIATGTGASTAIGVYFYNTRRVQQQNEQITEVEGDLQRLCDAMPELEQIFSQVSA